MSVSAERDAGISVPGLLNSGGDMIRPEYPSAGAQA